MDLDGIVAIADIVAAMLGRPLTPFESSRLKTAYQATAGGTLTDLAGQLAA
ncbi:hypothetical protein SAMN05445060_4042 [Williamsia sterculiae]|uniref:Uncharacterized protein n=1 Tax=Williamsia sterculiae TaxID=1344003 RepID=A0A1N7HDV7_9NOCA|nr:hypothetical protein SAMN05445060_4042 [Williamsia sterculiae]